MTFGYDGDGLLTSAGALTLQRDPLNGLLTGSTLASITDQWSYDAFGSPSSYIASSGATPLFSEQLTRNDAGQITQKSESVAGATHTVTYGYDNVGRLTSAAPDTGDPVTYGYDDNGNRTSRSTSASSETGSYDDQDRLLAYGATTFTYTSNGELATKTDASGTTAYNIDEMGNLLSVTLPAGTEIDYLIDGQNRRIAKTVAGTMTRQWIWSGPLRIAAELDGTGALVSRFVYATHTNVPDFMIRGGITYRLITDHLGSVRLVVDVSTGMIAERIDYDEFGRVLGDSNPGFQPFGFAGGLYDPDTGFVRFGARDYDPQAGRWTAKDPIGFDGGDSDLYAYVGNDPVNFIDPSGLDELTADPHVQEMILDLWKKAGYGLRPQEQAAWITRNPSTGQYGCVSWPQTHESNQIGLPRGWTKPLNTVAIMHTHPAVGNRTQLPDDAGDRLVAHATGVPIYTVTKQNGVGKYDPNTDQASKEEQSIAFPNAAKDGCQCH